MNNYTNSGMKEPIKIIGNKVGNSVEMSEGEFKGENQINFWRTSFNNEITIGGGCVFNGVKIVFKGNGNKLIIGANVRWTGHILIVGNNRIVTIGSDTTAQGVYVLSRDEDVEIGERCMLSREIEIRSTDVHKIYDLETNEHLNKAKKITIGNDVWIAARVIVSKGAVIPNNSVVGASSFVNKEFYESNVVIAGSPAKIVKKGVRWER